MISRYFNRMFAALIGRRETPRMRLCPDCEGVGFKPARTGGLLVRCPRCKGGRYVPVEGR